VSDVLKVIKEGGFTTIEPMNDKINLLFVDELLDAGLDTAGVEASLVIGVKLFLPTRNSFNEFIWYLINT
jgi:hypothetical protein